jgi:diguanylate cyclase
MCVLPGVALNGCYEVAERVRERIAVAHVTKRATGESVGQVTISIGVAEFIPGESFETLFERCDNALYQAKQSGRNCTIAA